MSRALFDHIAIGMPRMADAPELLAGVLGGMPEHGRPSGVFRWGTWRFAGGGCIEIIEPMGVDGFLHRFLARRGPGIHHVTFKVPRLDEACQRARACGYTPVGHDDSDPSWKEAFLHPKQALGIVVQVVEVNRTLHAAKPRWPVPAGPQNPPPPVTLLGLRLRAHSRQRALTQWETILAGECTEDSIGALIFHWPGSPMRIAVEIDATGDEGPIAIEVESERRLALPDGPHPALGTVFSQGSLPADAPGALDTSSRRT